MNRRRFATLLLLACPLPAPLLAQTQTTRSAKQPVLDVTSMDTSAEPCSDFFTYSCGGWIAHNRIPPDQTSWSAYGKLADENRQVLRDILERAARPSADRGPVQQKIGDYYAACMDEKAIDAAGIKPIEEQLAQIGNMQSTGDAATVLAAMVDDNMLFDFSSQQDFSDSSQVIAVADQGGLGLPDRDYYLKDDPKSVDLRKTYLAHVQKMFELLGDKPEAASAAAEVVMHIETELAKGSMTRVDRRDPQKLNHKLTTRQLQALSPAFAWGTYFTKVGLPSLQALNVPSLDFVKAMNAELEKESLDNWKTYLRWHLIHANAAFLTAAFVNANFDFYGKTLGGAKELRPRWKRCVGYVDGDLGEALGQAYVEQYFSPEAKQQALTMVSQIEAAMERDLQSLPWMGEATRQHALQKLHAVANKVGYPDKWRDYSALRIDRNDELGNVLRARTFEFNRELAKIGKPLDHGEWDMTPPTVNAYYNDQMNDINFPAGILQPPLFDPNSDAAPNYGNTGGTIGHELTHGFDDQGRQFDAQGSLKDWWTPEDAQQFEQRASCIADQYAQYVVVDNIKINSKLTLGEDVADLGGLILAYMAWKEVTKDQKLKPIEGFTPEQRFFIGYGQSWCGQTRDETLRMRAVVDPHSPEKYRTNGVLSNMPEFQEAFHCKPDAPMVRSKRCRVW
jgi:putative endopeptidase